MNKKFRALKGIAVVLMACCTAFASACSFLSCESDITGQYFTISYTDYDGEHEISARHGFDYKLDEVPSRGVGYEFLGLFTEEEGGEQYVKANGDSVGKYTDRNNITLYPHWKVSEYTVVLNYGGGSGSVKSVNAVYDKSLPELPTSVEYPHYVFKGWYTAANCGGVQVADTNGLNPIVSVVNTDNFTILANTEYINLYAGYDKEKYSVTLKFGNGVSDEKVTAEYDTPVGELNYKTRAADGKAVLKWSTKYDLSDDFGGVIEENTTLYAKEWANAITFDTDGGKELAPVVAVDGAGVTLPTPEKDLYKFLRWEKADGTEFKATVMPAESLTVKAVWQSKIVFDTRGGEEVDDISVAAGADITLPKPEKEGFIFAGWYTQDDQPYTATKMPAAGIKVSAKYYKAVKKTVVLIKASEEKGNTLDNPTKPSTSIQAHQINLSEMYEAGVTEVKLTAHYDVRYVWGAGGMYYTNPNSATASMNYYYQSPASDAYKVWSYGDTINKDDNMWRSRTQTTTIQLKSPTLFVCRYMSAWSTFGSGTNARWRDFYLEFEYADKSAIF